MPDANPELAQPTLPDLDDAAYQRALAVLLDVGTALALELKSPSPDSTPAQRAAAFQGVALAVRRTIILSRHIATDPQTARPAPIQRADARRQIIRQVEDTIGDKADPAEADALRVELLERLDQPEFDADLTNRTPADLIRELCRDLGLANRPHMPSFLRRTPDDIAILCAQAAAPPGTGLSNWLTGLPETSTPQPNGPIQKRGPPT